MPLITSPGLPGVDQLQSLVDFAAAQAEARDDRTKAMMTIQARPALAVIATVVADPTKPLPAPTWKTA